MRQRKTAILTKLSSLNLKGALIAFPPAFTDHGTSWRDVVLPYHSQLRLAYGQKIVHTIEMLRIEIGLDIVFNLLWKFKYTVTFFMNTQLSFLKLNLLLLTYKSYCFNNLKVKFLTTNSELRKNIMLKLLNRSLTGSVISTLYFYIFPSKCEPRELLFGP